MIFIVQNWSRHLLQGLGNELLLDASPENRKEAIWINSKSKWTPTFCSSNNKQQGFLSSALPFFFKSSSSESFNCSDTSQYQETAAQIIHCQKYWASFSETAAVIVFQVPLCESQANQDFFLFSFLAGFEFNLVVLHIAEAQFRISINQLTSLRDVEGVCCYCQWMGRKTDRRWQCFNIVQSHSERE